MALYNTELYSGSINPANLYTGSGADKPATLDFYRTEVDNQYVFYWTFRSDFVSPLLTTFDYELQLDTDSTFSFPTIFETITETFNVTAFGVSMSAPDADTTISAGLTLVFNLNNDGAATVTLSARASGAAIAADIQAKVRALTASSLANQAAYDNFTATFDITTSQYTLTSGLGGSSSSVIITGGTAQSALLLGALNSGFEYPGNSALLRQLPSSILFVQDSAGVTYAAAAINAPTATQYFANLVKGYVVFNASTVPITVTIGYVPTTSGDIIQFQRGNVAKGFTVFVPERVASSRLTFYVRVRVKNKFSYGIFSDVLTVQTLESVVAEASNRMLASLPDNHVYPVDEQYKALADRTSNISKILWAYANEFDLEYLEKENTLRDTNPRRTRDNRLYNVIGSKFVFPKPSSMEFVDYRVLAINSQAASLVGGTYEALNLVGKSFTGVLPTVAPIYSIFNFITANEELTAETIVIPLMGTTYTLANVPSSVPIIPGALQSGAAASVGEGFTVPASAPYTVVLSNKSTNIPTIPGFIFTADEPTVGAFTVDFSTNTLRFNEDDAGISSTVTYIPFPSVSSGTIAITIDGVATTITLGAAPFLSKEDIAADLQSKIRAAIPTNISYENAQVIYQQGTDKLLIVSGNPAPTSASTVLVTGGTAAASLRLQLVDGATQTFGLSYVTSPTVPAVGQFTSNVSGGDGDILTFPIIEQGNTHVVIYKKKINVYSYLPPHTTQPTTIPLSAPYAVSLSTLSVNIPTISGYTFVDGAPAANQFAVNFNTGVITFNAANAGESISIEYVPRTPTPPTLFSRTEAGFGIKITLNNPGLFTLDLTNISYLLRKILPAYTKFILTVA